MNKNVFSISLLLLVGCSQATDEQYGKLVDMEFHAGHSCSDHTRTTMDENGVIKWDGNDKIFVNDKESEGTNVSSDGLYAFFKFSNMTTAPNYSALHPSSMRKSYSNGVYTINFPNTQEWISNDSFGNGVNPSVAYSTSLDLGFSNVCGILRFSVKRDDSCADFDNVGRIRFIAKNANEYVSGEAKVTPSSKSITMTGGSASSNQMDIVLPASHQTIDRNNTFVHFVLPPRAYAAGWGIQLIAKDANATVLASAAIDKPVTIQRSRITNLGTIHMKPFDISKLAAPRIYLSGAVGDPASKLEVSTDPYVSGLYFKFGSVIGIRSYQDDGTPGNADSTPNDPFVPDDIAFNPASLSITSGGDVPCFSSTMSMTADNHTNENLKKGLGDPCRLVGISLGELQTRINSGERVDNGKWMLPTYAGTDKSNQSFTGTTEERYSNTNDWCTIGSVAGCFFPKGVGTNYTLPGFTGVFLPAAGNRQGWSVNEIGLSGNYWTSTAMDPPHGFYLHFVNGTAYPRWINYPRLIYSVRCVPQQ